MGTAMSFMGLGGGKIASTQMLNFAMGTVYKQFIEKDIRDFDAFHIAILNIFNTFNEALPGRHYNVPPRKDVEDVFIQWKEAKEEDKKKFVVDFMTRHVNPSKIDNTTLITGIVTPPIAMAAKRAGENVPQIKIIKAIPDVIFVPSVTLLTLISVKISRRVLMGGGGETIAPSS